MSHFTLPEFTASQTAARQRIDNSLPPELVPAATDTLALLERIRELLSQRAGRDVPVIISSGYRCLALNAAVGSSPGSDHVRARAADITAPAFGTPREICEALRPEMDRLCIGQLIHEYGAWVHVSTRYPMLAANRVITISHAGSVPGIVEA